jgi:peroxiredoxin
MSFKVESTRAFHGAKSPTRPHVLILLFMLGASVILNVMLASKVSVLRSNIYMLKEEGRLQPGQEVPPIAARDAGDNELSISYAESDVPTVLYVFSPQCGWCTRNLANVKSLAQETRGRYRFIALSLSDKDFKDYVSRSELGFQSYAGISNETRAAYKLGVTPQTIVVSRDGRVQKAWSGAYSDDVEEQVEAFFGATTGASVG